MWIPANNKQIVGEVKERNQYFKALQEIRKIAATNYDEHLSMELKEQFRLILEQCDVALGLRNSGIY